MQIDKLMYRFCQGLVEICPIGVGSSLKRVCAGRQHPLSSASDVEAASPVPDNDALNGSCEETFEASGSTVSNAGTGSLISLTILFWRYLMLELSFNFLKIIYEVCQDG